MLASKFPVHLDNSIVDMFRQKLLENPYLHEIADFFIHNQSSSGTTSLVHPLTNMIAETSNYTINMTPVRISTKVVLCKIGIDIDLDIFYKHFECSTNTDKNYSIVSLEYMENPPKGAVKPKKKKQKKQCVGAAPLIVKKRKSFYNQATVIIHHHKNLNLKLFRNGSIHITGIIDIEQGQRAVHFLGDEIRRIYQIDPKITTSNIDDLGIPSWEVVMINSDFVCNFKIRREKLYEILDSQYNLIVNFESDNYPGVKTSYYWNVQDKDKTGICRCKSGKTCSGKGRGTAAPGDMCRKITISIFQSGKIIITGAREQTQIDDAYQFITEILRKYFNEVGRPILVLESNEVPEEIVVGEEDTSDVDEEIEF